MKKQWIILTITWLALAACSRQGVSLTPPPPATMPTVGPRPARGAIVASGEIVPARISELGFAVGGRLSEVRVTEGDRVAWGAALAALDDAQVEAQTERSQAAVAVAQADLALLEEGASAEQVAASHARVRSAEMRLNVAEAQLSSAQTSLLRAREQADVARTALADLEAGPTAEERAIAEAAVRSAENALWGAQSARDSVGGGHDRGHANDAELDQAEAAVGVAYEALQTAHHELARVKAGPRPLVVAQAEGNVRVAEAHVAEAGAQVEIAAAQVDVALASLEESRANHALVQTGTTPGQLGRGTALVAQAETALLASQAAGDALVLAAPYEATIVRVHATLGETALPGQVIITLADLDHYQVETTDLSERDVARIEVGQAVSIYVEALGIDLPGRIARIAARANTIGGDVVYTVVIALDETHPSLRWGMSVEASID